MNEPISILFVCMGNICRSPLAEGVFGKIASDRDLRERFWLDSAGTGGWHVGDPPDVRSVETAAKYGIDIADQLCRKLTQADFEAFDLILAMDRDNLADIMRLKGSGSLTETAMFLDYAGEGEIEIPDPYYGGRDGFELSYEMLARGSGRIIDRLLS